MFSKNSKNTNTAVKKVSDQNLGCLLLREAPTSIFSVLGKQAQSWVSLLREKGSFFVLGFRAQSAVWNQASCGKKNTCLSKTSLFSTFQTLGFIS